MTIVLSKYRKNFYLWVVSVLSDVFHAWNAIGRKVTDMIFKWVGKDNDKSLMQLSSLK